MGGAHVRNLSMSMLRATGHGGRHGGAADGSRLLVAAHSKSGGGRSSAPAAADAMLLPSDVAGTVSIVRPDRWHLSPAVGLALSGCGSHLLSRLYELEPHALSDGSRLTDGTVWRGTPACRLVRSLFYRVEPDEPLRPTTNRSLPAAHLSPSLAAHVLGLAEAGGSDAATHAALRAAVCSETGLGLPALARETGVSIARFQRLAEAVREADQDGYGDGNGSGDGDGCREGDGCRNKQDYRDEGTCGEADARLGKVCEARLGGIGGISGESVGWEVSGASPPRASAAILGRLGDEKLSGGGASLSRASGARSGRLGPCSHCAAVAGGGGPASALPRRGTSAVLRHLWLRASPSGKQALWPYFRTLHCDYGGLLTPAAVARPGWAEALADRRLPPPPSFVSARLGVTEIGPTAALRAVLRVLDTGGGQLRVLDTGGGQRSRPQPASPSSSPASFSPTSSALDSSSPSPCSSALSFASSFEVATAAIALTGRSPPPLQEQRVSPGHGARPVADCAELTLRELFNCLLWSKDGQAFAPARLPPTAHPGLVEFYSAGGKALTPSAAQEWMRLVSDLPGVSSHRPSIPSTDTPPLLYAPQRLYCR
jgi:hypothetical protein